MSNGGERLVYEITVTDPGARNQNWHGTLFDPDGNPLQVEPGKTATTKMGDFVSVAESTPGKPYGMIHANMIHWMKTENGNVIMDSEPWQYRLYVAQEGSKSEGWRGELRHRRGIITGSSGGEPLATPMGPYTWVENLQMWGRHGWVHVSWSHR